MSQNTLKVDFQTALELTQDKDFDAARRLYEKILQAYPLHAATHYNLAQLAAQMGDAKTAHQHFSQVIALEPDFPQGYFQLAQILLIEGDPASAIKNLQTAVRLAPDYIEAHHLLACSALQQQDLKLASVQFQRLLQLDPMHASGHLNFALLKLKQHDLEEAKKLLDSALALDPTLIEAHYHRGVIAMQQGDVALAVSEMQGTLDRQSDHFAANYNLGILYKLQHHYQLARHYLQQALKLKPGDESITFLLQALQPDEIPPQAPPPFVRELFDHYAQDYDVHMQKSLHYQVPQVLRELIEPYRDTLPVHPVILDLGCGTGLVGEYFKDLSAQLIGVDLAPQMLAKASARGLYTTLHTADILSYLQQSNAASYDLIIAADVLGYFGPLDKIFTACARALRPQGLFLFSIELSADKDYVLDTSVRYAHNPAYINAITQDQWQLLIQKTTALRQQEHQPVIGEIYLFKKS